MNHIRPPRGAAPEMQEFTRDVNRALADGGSTITALLERIAALEAASEEEVDNGTGINTPHLKARRTSSINIPFNTPTQIVCDTEDWDTDNIHNTGTGRVTIAVDGYYRITYSVKYELSTGDHVTITFLKKNGGSGGGGSDVVYKYGTHYNVGGAPYHQPVETKTETLYLVAGDYLELWAYQANPGAGTRVIGYDFDTTSLEIQRVR